MVHLPLVDLVEVGEIVGGDVEGDAAGEDPVVREGVALLLRDGHDAMAPVDGLGLGAELGAALLEVVDELGDRPESRGDVGVFYVRS